MAAALGAGAAVALAMTACGSSDDGSGGASATTTTEQTGAEQSGGAGAANGMPATPTVDELNQQLQTALDPNVPVDQKTDLVTGLEADPQLIQTLSDKVAEAEADGTLSDVAVTGPILPPSGDVLTVPFTANYGGQVQTGQATLLADGGQWKLDGDFVCGLAGGVGVESPACPAPAGS